MSRSALFETDQAWRVLAIDDDPKMFAIYKTIFKQQFAGGSLRSAKQKPDSAPFEKHFLLDTAVNGQEGIQKLVQAQEAQRPYAVIYLDMRMPTGWSGLHTAEKIRELDENVRIVLITAFTDHNLTEIRRRIGANFDFLYKPVNPTELQQLTFSLATQWAQSNNYQAALKAAKRAELAKDEFLASMSHELRTPLTAILGNGELLAETLQQQSQLALLQSMSNSGQHLLGLVNDILDVSKIKAGKFEIDYAPYDLVAVLEQMEQMFLLSAEESAIAFSVTQSIDPRYQLWGDSQRIGQILLNFLSNAFKFTERGSVVLKCWKQASEIYFSVEDSGIGMPPDVLERLFQPFEQADSSIARRYGGTGLGLYIAWKLAELMGGRVEATSRAGEGSRFVLILPYKESELALLSDRERLKGAPQQQPNERFTGTILLAEDSPELQLLVSRLLQAMGDITVTVVADGEKAMEKATEQPFDLILMDMQMPVMNGLDATRGLRQRGVDTPVVALTANVMERHKQQFYDAGANGFLQKPLEKDELKKILKMYLDSGEFDRNSTADVSAVPSDEVDTVESRKKLPVLVIDDDYAILQLYQSMFSVKRVFQKSLGYLLVLSDAEAEVQSSPKSGDEFAITVAEQGVYGVEKARQALEQGDPFPVALIDMRMPPGIDGLETAKRLRQLDPRIYIVIVSAYSDTHPEELESILGDGVFYISKPFDKQEVMDVVRRLSSAWCREHLEALPSTQGAEREQPPHPEIDEELMAIFVESAIKYHAELATALVAKEWSAVRATAHTIKGSSASFGFSALSAMAEEYSVLSIRVIWSGRQGWSISCWWR